MALNLSKDFCQRILDDIRLDVRPMFNNHLMWTWYPVFNNGWKELFVFVNENKEKLGFAFGDGDTVYVYAVSDDGYKFFTEDNSWKDTWVEWDKFERIGLI